MSSQSSVVLLPAERSGTAVGSTDEYSQRTAAPHASDSLRWPSPDHTAYAYPERTSPSERDDVGGASDRRHAARSPSPSSPDRSSVSSKSDPTSPPPRAYRPSRADDATPPREEPKPTPPPTRATAVLSIMDVPEFPSEPLQQVRRALHSTAHSMVADTANTRLPVWYQRLVDTAVQTLRTQLEEGDGHAIAPFDAADAPWPDAAIAAAFDRLATRWRNCLRRGTQQCLTDLSNLRADLDAIFMNAQQVLSHLDRAFSHYASQYGDATTFSDASLSERASSGLVRRTQALMETLRSDSLQAVRAAVEANIPREEHGSAQHGVDVGLQADVETLKRAIEDACECTQDAHDLAKRLRLLRDRRVRDSLNETLRAFEDCAYASAAPPPPLAS